MLPPAFGNPSPRSKLALTLPPGPRRVTDDGERSRFHVATVGKLPVHRSQGPPIDLRRCREILVVKLDFIGDWVLTTPFLDNLRRNAPRARITAIVLERVFDLASACPSVDRVIAVSRAERGRVVLGAASISELAPFRGDYLGGRFDLAVVPRWDADFNGALKFAFGSRAPHVVGFSERSTPRKRRLNRGDDRFYTHAHLDSRVTHEGDRDLALISAMRGRVVAVPANADFDAADQRQADRFLKARFGRGPPRFLAVAPFGSEPQKTLPAAELAPVIRRLATRFDLGVVVVGSRSDAEEAAAFIRNLFGCGASTAGVLGTRESAALIARAVAFIGMDSGPAHIAAAVGTPVAVLFAHPLQGDPAHTRAPQRFAPRGRPGQVLVIQPEVATAPCRDGCEAADAHCILALTENVLWPRLSKFVGAALRGQRPAGPRAAAFVRIPIQRPLL